jgi:zinc/manganese transport system substrate-binding protein
MSSLEPKRIVLALLLALVLPARAAAAVKVVTTTEGLAAIVKEVGGDRVQVESLSRGVQDPHFVDANPMLAVKLRNADLLVDVGLDLEIGWLPPLVTQSRNGDIQPGGARRFTAASAIEVLDVPTGPVSRGCTLSPQVQIVPSDLIARLWAVPAEMLTQLVSLPMRPK